MKVQKISVALQDLMDESSSVEQYQELAAQTFDYLKQTNINSTEIKAHLMDIMMAQDFQDLTGQVLKKVTELVQNVEQ